MECYDYDLISGCQLTVTLAVGAGDVGWSSNLPVAFQSISRETHSSAIETGGHSAQPKEHTHSTVHLAPYTTIKHCH